MRKLALPFTLAVVVSAAFFNVAAATASTVGDQICPGPLCESGTPAGLDYRDWDGYKSSCHKNNLANPYFYYIDYPAPNISWEFDRPGDTWWVADQGAGTAGNGDCPDSSSNVIAKTAFNSSVSVISGDADDRYVPACQSNNPCNGRTTFYVELTAVPINGTPVSAGGSVDTTRP